MLQGELEPPVRPVEGVHHPAPVTVVAVAGSMVELVGLVGPNSTVVHSRSKSQVEDHDVADTGSLMP